MTALEVLGLITATGAITIAIGMLCISTVFWFTWEPGPRRKKVLEWLGLK